MPNFKVVKVISFLLFLMMFNLSFGQRFQQYKPSHISVKSKLGFVIAHRSNMAHLPHKITQAVEICLAQQDLSNTAWANNYKKGVRGVSFMFQDFGNKNVLGQGISLFGHTSFPIYQGEKFGFLDFRLGTGVAYVTKKYDFRNTKAPRTL